jgi:hypothetical protein
MIINNFLAALNIPTISSTTLKRREREVGCVFEAVAQESCNDALLDEKKRYGFSLHLLFYVLLKNPCRIRVFIQVT